MTTRAVFTPALVIATAGAAAAQCQPEWNATIGNPGIGSGYAGAFRAWDDGTGEALYVGGTFNGIVGVPGTAFLARWDRPSNTWSRVGGGIISQNTTFITSMVPFNPGTGEELIVGGSFGSAAGAAGTKSLARWNGTRWTSLGSNLVPNTADSVWSMKVWNGRLFVGGNFLNIGGVAVNGIASWDGVTWSALGSGVGGAFNPVVFAMETFDDGSGEALYAAGRFDSAGGVSGTRWIARWNGQAWSAVGGPLSPSTALSGPEGLVVWDDGNGAALYMAGPTFTPPAQPPTSVGKWNGQQWTSVGPAIGTGRLTSIAAFDDGTGETLYIGGTAMPQINQVAKLVGGQWVSVGGGHTGPPIPPSNFPSVFGMRVWGDSLYVGGNFTEAGGVPARGLVAWAGCESECYPDCDTTTGQGNLDIFDFLCFQNRYDQNAPYACDCDLSTGPGQCDIFDFLCFQNAYDAGCP